MAEQGPKTEPPKHLSGAEGSVQDFQRQQDFLRQIASAAETIALAGSAGTAPPSIGAPMAGLDLSRVAETSIARLLGGPLDGNAGRLLQRLAAVFPAKPGSDGTIAYEYRPTGAQPAEGQNGALVSGAQAVFYQQAKVLGTTISKLLDNLEPVVTDPDDATIASLIALFRTKTDGVVEEFGRDGGAVLPRITAASETLNATLADLTAKLGLGGGNSRYDVRELDMMQLDLVGENMEMLRQLKNQLTGKLLDDYKARVVGGVGASFVRLSWTVRAIPVAIDDVAAEFDALRIFSADRMLLWLGGGENFSVEQALQWCRDASTSEWPQLLADGRRADLLSVQSEARRLAEAIGGLATNDPKVSPVSDLVGGIRLVAALQELNKLLRAVVEELTKLLQPVAAAFLAAQTAKK